MNFYVNRSMLLQSSAHRFRCHLMSMWILGALLSISGCTVSPPVTPVPGATAPPPPMTLPRFLGVDTVTTGVRRVVYRTRIRASHVLPVLQPSSAAAAPVAICDPSCLASPSPAVATAAELQQAQAAAPAKIQAIGFLATQDICRNPKVEEAFLAAMDDPSDSVRMAAVQGIIDANQSCGGCNHGCNGCCTEALQNKLIQMATATDASGCWCEPNPKVRRLARIASCKCNPRFATPPVAMPEEIPAPSILVLANTPPSS